MPMKFHKEEVPMDLRQTDKDDATGGNYLYQLYTNQLELMFPQL
jgi:hypothetical protein